MLFTFGFIFFQAFSVFFVFIALTSDMICFLFIPVHWLFFAASTYVWVQYVWHTEKGICLSTISLWLLFVYIEASIRLKELKSLPFHLDLCRPFAAHWYARFFVSFHVLFVCLFVFIIMCQVLSFYLINNFLFFIFFDNVT